MGGCVVTAFDYNTKGGKAPRVAVVLFHHFSTALMLRAIFSLLLGGIPTSVTMPLLNVVAHATTAEDRESPATAAADISSSQGVTSKDQLPQNAPLNTDGEAPAEEGKSLQPERHEAAQAVATPDDPSAATPQKATPNETPTTAATPEKENSDEAAAKAATPEVGTPGETAKKEVATLEVGTPSETAKKEAATPEKEAPNETPTTAATSEKGASDETTAKAATPEVATTAATPEKGASDETTAKAATPEVAVQSGTEKKAATPEKAAPNETATKATTSEKASPNEATTKAAKEKRTPAANTEKVGPRKTAGTKKKGAQGAGRSTRQNKEGAGARKTGAAGPSSSKKTTPGSSQGGRGGAPARKRASSTPTRSPASVSSKKANTTTSVERLSTGSSSEQPTRVSPLAAAAYERAAAVSTPRTTAENFGERNYVAGLANRYAVLRRGGASALDRAAAATRVLPESSHAPVMGDPYMNERPRTSRVPTTFADFAPGEAKDATGGAARKGELGAGAWMRSPGPRSSLRRSPPPAAASGSPPETGASFAAALLTGTVRRLAFERCDRYTQKATITASPGDTVIAECHSAASTVPTDIESLCCKGSSGRCTDVSAVPYTALYHSAAIPNFRYAAGDGISRPWKVKIPESLQPPFPTFSVTWLGPTPLDIPTEACTSVTGIPTTTLAIKVEALAQPEEKLALLRSPGTVVECKADEPPKKEEGQGEKGGGSGGEDDSMTDEERRAEYGKLYERTPFGLRRVSHAAPTAARHCARHVNLKEAGVISLLSRLHLLRCIQWNAILSVAVTSCITLWMYASSY